MKKIFRESWNKFNSFWMQNKVWLFIIVGVFCTTMVTWTLEQISETMAETATASIGSEGTNVEGLIESNMDHPEPFTGLDFYCDSIESNYTLEVQRRIDEENFFIELSGNEEQYYEDRGLTVIDYISGIITDGNTYYYYPVVICDTICWTDTEGKVHIGISSLEEERVVMLTLHSPFENEAYTQGNKLECNLEYEIVSYNGNLYLYSLGNEVDFIPVITSPEGRFVGINPDEGYIFQDEGELYEIKVCKWQEKYFFLKEPFNKEDGAK